MVAENAASPVLSHLPASMADEIRRMPGIRAVAPEVWGVAPTIEGRGMLLKGIMSGKNLYSLLDQPVISGQEILAHQNLHSAVFPRALKEHGEGRFLVPEDRGKPNIVISKKIAAQHPDASGKPKKVGDTLHISGKPYQIVGIYETGSMILDVVIVMDIEMAREVLSEPKNSVSCIYVEADDPSKNAAVAAAIETAHPDLTRGA